MPPPLAPNLTTLFAIKTLQQPKTQVINPSLYNSSNSRLGQTHARLPTIATSHDHGDGAQAALTLRTRSRDVLCSLHGDLL